MLRTDSMTGPARVARVSIASGGVPKRVAPAVRVTTLGIEDDVPRDPEHHGRPERALCPFIHERIRALQAEGDPITSGSICENLTCEGGDWSAVVPGTLPLGAEVNVTGSFRDHDSRVSQKRLPSDVRFMQTLTEDDVSARITAR